MGAEGSVKQTRPTPPATISLAHEPSTPPGHWSPGQNRGCRFESCRPVHALMPAQDRRARRRLLASRPPNTSKIAQPRSATAQSFQVPNHSRFGVPCTSQTMSQTKLATAGSYDNRCALAAQPMAQQGQVLQSQIQGDDAVPKRDESCLEPRPRAKCLEQTADVISDRFRRQVQVRGDLVGALALDKQPQHVELARRQLSVPDGRGRSSLEGIAIPKTPTMFPFTWIGATVISSLASSPLAETKGGRHGRT